MVFKWKWRIILSDRKFSRHSFRRQMNIINLKPFIKVVVSIRIICPFSPKIDWRKICNEFKTQSNRFLIRFDWNGEVRGCAVAEVAAAHVHKVLRWLFPSQYSKSIEKTETRIISGSMWILKKALYNYTFIFRTFLASNNVGIHIFFNFLYGCFNKMWNEQLPPCVSPYPLLTAKHLQRESKWEKGRVKKEIRYMPTTKWNVLVMRCRYCICNFKMRTPYL